jgi:hypothetical protein
VAELLAHQYLADVETAEATQGQAKPDEDDEIVPISICLPDTVH